MRRCAITIAGLWCRLDESWGSRQKHYRVSEEELDWLSARVEELGAVVQLICSERIAQLEARAQAAE
jgi:hypothetical protein